MYAYSISYYMEHISIVYFCRASLLLRATERILMCFPNNPLIFLLLFARIWKDFVFLSPFCIQLCFALCFHLISSSSRGLSTSFYNSFILHVDSLLLVIWRFFIWFILFLIKPFCLPRASLLHLVSLTDLQRKKPSFVSSRLLFEDGELLQASLIKSWKSSLLAQLAPYLKVHLRVLHLFGYPMILVVGSGTSSQLQGYS